LWISAKQSIKIGMDKSGVFAVSRGVFDHPLFAREPFTEREAWIWLGMNPVTRRRRLHKWLADQWQWSGERRVTAFLERACNVALIEINDEGIRALPLEGGDPSAVRPGTSSWRALRQMIFERDGFACVYCGNLDDLACDHVHPRSRGGKNDPSNLVTACKPCNSSKRDRTPEEWRR
jgi:hypothetical protein